MLILLFHNFRPWTLDMNSVVQDDKNKLHREFLWTYFSIWIILARLDHRLLCNGHIKVAHFAMVNGIEYNWIQVRKMADGFYYSKQIPSNAYILQNTLFIFVSKYSIISRSNNTIVCTTYYHLHISSIDLSPDMDNVTFCDCYQWSMD